MLLCFVLLYSISRTAFPVQNSLYRIPCRAFPEQPSSTVQHVFYSISCKAFPVQQFLYSNSCTQLFIAFLLQHFLTILLYSNFLYSVILHTCIIGHRHPEVYMVVSGKRGQVKLGARARARAPPRAIHIAYWYRARLILVTWNRISLYSDIFPHNIFLYKALLYRVSCTVFSVEHFLYSIFCRALPVRHFLYSICL